MTSNKHIYLFVIFVTFFFYARMASAIDIGLGATLTTGDGPSTGLMVPIRLESITIEPEITYSNRRDNTKDKLTGQKGDGNNGRTNILAGIYLRKGFGKGIEAYYGGRVGIGQSQNNDKYTDGSKRDSTRGSIFLIPTLGLQYFFNKQFSMGVDAGLRIEQYTEKYKRTNSSGVITTNDNTDGIRTALESRVVVRALF